MYIAVLRYSTHDATAYLLLLLEYSTHDARGVLLAASSTAMNRSRRGERLWQTRFSHEGRVPVRLIIVRLLDRHELAVTARTHGLGCDDATRKFSACMVRTSLNESLKWAHESWLRKVRSKFVEHVIFSPRKNCAHVSGDHIVVHGFSAGYILQ